MKLFVLVVVNYILLIDCFVKGQGDGDATSLNAPNCGMRPLVSESRDEPSKIVGGTQALVGE